MMRAIRPFFWGVRTGSCGACISWACSAPPLKGLIGTPPALRTHAGSGSGSAGQPPSGGGWVRRLRCAGRCTRFPSLQTFSLLAVWDAGSWTGSSRPFDDRRGGSAACNRRRAWSALGADSARFVIKVERPRIGIRRRSISSFNSSCSAIAVCFICCVRTGGRRNPSSLRAWRQRMRCA